jgi:hypothetical protein
VFSQNRLVLGLMEFDYDLSKGANLHGDLDGSWFREGGGTRSQRQIEAKFNRAISSLLSRF